MHPLARGGSNDEGNLTVACISCNRSKGKKTYVEFTDLIRERERERKRECKRPKTTTKTTTKKKKPTKSESPSATESGFMDWIARLVA